MDTYDQLLNLAKEENLEVYERNFETNALGLIKGNKIGIDKKLNRRRKSEVLLHEIIHHFYSINDITYDIKEEHKVKKLTYQKILPLKLIQRVYIKCCDFYELAEELDVSEEFLKEAIDFYIRKYGQTILKYNPRV